MASPATARIRMSETVYVTPGYFETLSVPLLQGRTFRESVRRKATR